MERYKKLLIALTIGLLMPIGAINSVMARALTDDSERPSVIGKTAVDYPNAQFATHNVGKIGLSITNTGSFGTGFYGSGVDPLIGIPAPSCQYPYPSNFDYLFAAAFWIGTVGSWDTLVSVGADGWAQVREMWPDPIGVEGSGIERHSTNDPDDELAVSEQDYIAKYTDTLTDNNYTGIEPWDFNPHTPLNIEITQRSYAWSYANAEDFILFDLSIKNIGQSVLSQVYMGIYVDGDVGRVGGPTFDYTDDICGFKRTVPSPLGCGFIDTVNIAWIADNDGRTASQINNPCPGAMDITGVTGIRILRTPSDSLKYSFNWWVSNGDAPQDFGPRMAGTEDDPFRDFGGYLGTPTGDRDKYYIMRHEEFDYDQLFTAVNHTSEGWLPPPSNAANLACGFDTRYLLSFGPFDIMPGQRLPITFAYIAGENFHTNCYAFKDLFKTASPDAYYNQLNFSDLAKNALWAEWIYDTPGVDTDGDGYKGKYRICGEDTIYYQGDAVPDYHVDSPTDIPGQPGSPAIPNGFTLYQNYPNPFNAATEITFEIPTRAEVTLAIYNILGETIREIEMGDKPAGKHAIIWDGTDDSHRPVSSGIYFYKIRAGTFADAKKMILLK
jgi:hypothetical protein